VCAAVRRGQGQDPLRQRQAAVEDVRASIGSRPFPHPGRACARPSASLMGEGNEGGSSLRGAQATKQSRAVLRPGLLRATCGARNDGETIITCSSSDKNRAAFGNVKRATRNG